MKEAAANVYYPSPPYTPQTRVTASYSVPSSVVHGGVITEVNGAGQKVRTYAYANGQVIGWHYEATHAVEWNVADPITGSRKETGTGGVVNRETESDPEGVNVGQSDPNLAGSYEPSPEAGLIDLVSGRDDGTSGRCRLDGISVRCALADSLLRSGVAVSAPAETTRYRNGRFEFFRAYADGYQGWGALGAVSNGQGGFVNTNRSRVAPHLRTPAEATRPRRAWDSTRPRVVGNSEGGGGGQLSLSPDVMFAQGLHFLQSSQNPFTGCITGRWLINSPEIKATFDAVWQQTMKSGKENGGWMFYEPKTNTIHIRYASEGEKTSMDNEAADFANQLRQFQQSGMSVIFIAMFHTHPNEGQYPSSVFGDMDVIAGRNNVSSKGGAPPMGFVIYGLGKYTPYNQNSVLFDVNSRVNGVDRNEMTRCL